MARLNIEDELFKDQRFFDLGFKLGDRFKAIGCLVALWSLGQEYWKKDRSLIPKEKWEQQRLPYALVEVGFVEEKEHGFYVKGSKDYFDWLRIRAENGKKGGKKSGETRSSDNSNLEGSKPKQSEANASKPNPLTLTHTLAHVHDNSLAKNSLNPDKPDSKKKPVTQDSWEAYKKSYESRYSVEPIRNPKINSQLKNLVQRVGKEEAPKVVEFYLSCSDDWLVKKMHPIGILLQDCETYHTRWKAGIQKINNRKHQAFSQKNQATLDWIQELEREEQLEQVRLSDGKN